MGYIYKRHGKGTFVSALNQQSQNLMDSYSFTDHMKSQGKTPTTKVLSFEILESTNYFAEKLGITPGDKMEKLGITPGDKMIKIVRLRLADDIPMMLERTYLPFTEFTGLTEEKVVERPLYEIFKDDYNEIVRLRLADDIPMMLERTYLPFTEFTGLTEEKVVERPLYEIFKDDYNEIIKVADEEFSAGIVSDKESKLLDVPVDSACLKLLRTTYNDNNIVIEFTLSVARSDKFVYKIRHVR